MGWLPQSAAGWGIMLDPHEGGKGMGCEQMIRGEARQWESGGVVQGWQRQDVFYLAAIKRLEIAGMKGLM